MIYSSHKTISGADIVFPDDQPLRPPAAPAPTTARIDVEAVVHEVYQELGRHACLNQNQRLVFALKALIVAGLDQKPKLILAASHLGFNRGHAGAVISKSQGADPGRHLWYKDGAGSLVLHAAAAAA